MREFLSGLLVDLDERLMTLLDHLAARREPETEQCVVRAVEAAERARLRVEHSLALLDEGNVELTPVLMRRYARQMRTCRRIETRSLPIVSRFDEADRRLTRLCRRLCEEIGWSGPVPIVGAFAQEYYWADPELLVIGAPELEARCLLGLPDLLHELGHHVYAHRRGALADGLDQLLGAYLSRLDRPPPPDPDFAHDFARQWARWWDELWCDGFAAYVGGPAYGWQHVRLSASNPSHAFEPVLPATMEHPADDARLQLITATLRICDRGEDADDLDRVWAQFKDSSGESPDDPDRYDACYPRELLADLAEAIAASCRTLGLRAFADQAPATALAAIDDAWAEFRARPEHYASFEHKRLERLWKELAA